MNRLAGGGEGRSGAEDIAYRDMQSRRRAPGLERLGEDQANPENAFCTSAWLFWSGMRETSPVNETIHLHLETM